MNVLLEPATRRVKLADFGLARNHSHAAEAMMTRGIGTPVFMAPELFGDHDGVLNANGGNVRAEGVYALGETVLQLWFKKAPFD